MQHQRGEGGRAEWEEMLRWRRVPTGNGCPAKEGKWRSAGFLYVHDERIGTYS